MAALGIAEKLILLAITSYWVLKFFGPGLSIALFIATLGYLYITIIMGSPCLYLNDLQMMKRFLVKDFQIFANRGAKGAGMQFLPENSIFQKILATLQDEHWKNVRNTVTPAFTAGKLKMMLPLMEHPINTLMEVLNEISKSEQNTFIAKEVFGAFTVDLIAAVAFATECESQRNPDHPFVRHLKASESFSLSGWKVMCRTLLFPWTLSKLENIFGFQLIYKETEAYFKKSLSTIIRQRRTEGKSAGRKDFLQLLLDASESNEASSGEFLHDNEITSDIGGKHVKLTEEEIIAQCLIFISAGYDTTSNTLMFSAYSLALHPDVQRKCREEVLEAVGEDRRIDYDTIQHKLPYLDAAISETLRMYPPASRISRHCSADFKISDTITVPKGSTVATSAYVIHHSEEYYPNPEEFRPERFLPEEKAKRNPLLFLPFGFGPRNCIGLRFAQFEMKLCLANVLRKFRILPCDMTEKPPLKLKSVRFLSPVQPVALKLEKILE